MRRRRRTNLRVAWFIAVGLALLLVLVWFNTALDNLSRDRGDESRRLLEDSLHRAATICYAADGCYPASLEQLCQRCGIQIDERRFTVYYDCFAENLVPDITVLDNGYEETTDATT